MTIPNFTLNNGVEIPALGFGVYQTPPEGTAAAVESAPATGYRHIDPALSVRLTGGPSPRSLSRRCPHAGYTSTRLLRTPEIVPRATGDESGPPLTGRPGTRGTDQRRS